MGPAPKPEAARFESKISRTEGCWLWNGTVGANGYGYFHVKRDGRWVQMLAHRYSFEHHIGPIEAGATLDHLCMTPRCVKPQHLDPCPTGENTRRSPHTLTGRNIRKTHCPQGHPYAGTNLFLDQGKRKCRTCVRAKNRAADHRRRAAWPPPRRG